MFRIPAFAVILTFVAAAGCANYASYPPLEGEASIDQATQAPIPEVIATAIEWCVAREDFRSQQEPVIFSLPASMGDDAHAAVAEQLNSNGLETDPSRTDGIEIRSVRMFGLKAMVDMTVPRGTLPPQLVTLELQSYVFQPWHVSGSNRWRFNEDQLKRTSAELQQASAESGS